MQVHYYNKAIICAFNEANKDYHKGVIQIQYSGAQADWRRYLQARNVAWMMAMGTYNDCIWEQYREMACEFAMELRNEKTRAWKQLRP
jgi:hypothetical protein